MKKNSAIGFGIAITSFSLIGLFLSARFAAAVTISEYIVEINAKPGDVIERTMQLFDDSLVGLTVYPTVANFMQDPAKEGSAIVLTDPKDLRPDIAWVSFDAKEVVLPPGGGLVPFTYRITVPADRPEPGTHLLSLVFQVKPPEATGQISISIATNVVTNIFLRVAGATKDSLSANFLVGTLTNRDATLPLAELKKNFQEKHFFSHPPVDFLAVVENNGNTHQRPDGNIRIQNDLLGGIFEKLTINDERNIILPGTSRTFRVEPFGQGLMIGKYRATLTLVYGDPLRDEKQVVTFWIIPVVEMAIALGVVLILILLIWLIRRSQRKRSERQALQREELLRSSIVQELSKRQTPPTEPPPPPLPVSPPPQPEEPPQPPPPPAIGPPQ